MNVVRSDGKAPARHQRYGGQTANQGKPSGCHPADECTRPDHPRPQPRGGLSLMQDAHTERALNNLRQRHEDKIRENAERIQKHVGYVLQRISVGHAASTGYYAQGIVADAQNIVARVVALEAIGETTGIFDAQDTEADQ